MSKDYTWENCPPDARYLWKRNRVEKAYTKENRCGILTADDDFMYPTTNLIEALQLLDKQLLERLTFKLSHMKSQLDDLVESLEDTIADLNN